MKADARAPFLSSRAAARSLRTAFLLSQHAALADQDPLSSSGDEVPGVCVRRALRRGPPVESRAPRRSMKKKKKKNAAATRCSPAAPSAHAPATRARTWYVSPLSSPSHTHRHAGQRLDGRVDGREGDDALGRLQPGGRPHVPGQADAVLLFEGGEMGFRHDGEGWGRRPRAACDSDESSATREEKEQSAARSVVFLLARGLLHSTPTLFFRPRPSQHPSARARARPTRAAAPAFPTQPPSVGVPSPPPPLPRARQRGRERKGATARKRRAAPP